MAIIDKEDRTRLERLVAIDERISNNRYPTMKVLCQAFNVRPRTIYADIRLLRERFGLDIRFDRFRNGYYNANPGKRIPIGDLVEDDYLLAITGCFALSSIFGSQMETVLRQVVSQMGKRLTFELAPKEDDLGEIFIRSRPKIAEVDPTLMANLCRALLQNRLVEMRMHTGESTECVPCSFVEDEGGWWLLAHNPERSRIEKYELAKIAACEVKEQQSLVQRKDVLQQYLANASN